jgi:hypothetical protein
MLFVVRNSFSLYVLSMDASIYANEIFTEFVTAKSIFFKENLNKTNLRQFS